MDSQAVIQVIPAYQDQANYIQAARLASEAELADVWWQQAVAPRWAEWAEGQFNEARTREQMKRPFTQLDELELEIKRLAESGVEPLIEREMSRILRALPSPLPERAVCIFAADPENGWVRQEGVLGTGIGDNILLQINPLAANWERLVPYVLAHEYHHAIWGYHYFAVRGQSRMDLLTGLMIDGEADSFAAGLYPDAHPSWIYALTPEQEREQWALMQAHLSSGDGKVYERFFFGDRVQGTPLNTAYTIGFHIVQEYLQTHPGCGVLDLMNQDAGEVLAESGYGK